MENVCEAIPEGSLELLVHSWKRGRSDRQTKLMNRIGVLDEIFSWQDLVNERLYCMRDG